MTDILLKALKEIADESPHHDTCNAMHILQTTSARKVVESDCSCQRADAREAISEFEKTKGWRPIKTAPKDKTPFLACLEDQTYAVVYWDTSYWYENSMGLIIDEPKYWMPLPAPPEEKKS